MKKNETIENAIPALETKPNLPEIKVLTRKQVKDLRASGFDISAISKATDLNKSLDLVDYILDKIYEGENFDEISNKDAMEFALKTFKTMFDGAPETKN